MFTTKDLHGRAGGRGGAAWHGESRGDTTWVNSLGSAARLARHEGAALPPLLGETESCAASPRVFPSVTFNTDDTNTLSGTWLALSTGRYRFLMRSGGSGWAAGLESGTCFATRARRRHQRLGSGLPMSVLLYKFFNSDGRKRFVQQSVQKKFNVTAGCS
ncbi:hypothetical protein E2C01_081882 [Portunus trituberculatus]|uniref:Uncharacterized protein n=1 Tax=Portunus trituberculatus TaxID=210409 RepID=A0A5B7IXT2_PORTR|nr:hypothetical protein [Portunus trituberculatus]